MPPILHVRPDRSPVAPDSARNSDQPSIIARVAPPSPPCQLRELTTRDVPAIERMLAALDVNSRCARFGWASSDDALMMHSRSLVAKATHLIGAFAFGELRGILEIYGGTTDAEVALVVTPEFRRRGFGRAMLAAAAAWAEQNDLASIHLVFSRENWPMRQLAAAADARLDIALDEIRATIHMPHGGLA